ncbi:MAG TPA: hypothetical protein VGN73_06555 [Gemmatimonadaceae bacterium]|nr:hypothetical protein [Gemmatimonadaceae bacterium]
MRRIQRFFLIFTIAASVASIPVTARAQCTASGAGGTCNLAGSVSTTAGRVVRLQMTAGSTSLTAPTPADFDAGFNATTGPTLTVSANAAWTLHIRSSTAFWGATNTSPGAPARTTKPAADLRWSTASNGTFTALSASDITLVAGSATASSATTLYFRTFYNWTLDTPGNYSLSIVLTLTAP